MSKTRYNWKKLEKHWDKHQSVSAIAKYMGASAAGVRRQLKQKKIGPYAKKKVRIGPWREEHRQFLSRTFPTKFDPDEVNADYDKYEGDVGPIAERLKCSTFAVVRLMRRHKLGPFREPNE